MAGRIALGVHVRNAADAGDDSCKHPTIFAGIRAVS